MYRKIIYDSNIWISFLYTDDSNFDKAKEILSKAKPFVLTEYIVLEVSTVLKQKAGEQ
ncbi:MAG TPA: PIN domain-containing protein, partial [Trueperaceae bacterium]|nr:PIN domain-containing protein [Trueperaceae bacterium]